MTEPVLLPDDDQPTGLPRIDGDSGAGDDAPAHDLEGLGIGEGDEDVGLDDGGFLDEDDEIDTLDESAPVDDEAWETAESEPHDDDPSIEAPEESSWVGPSAHQDSGEFGSGDEDDEDEHAASALDAGEEGFADEAPGAESEPDGAPSALGAADDEGLDEVAELDGDLEARGYELRPLAVTVEPVGFGGLARSIVALALAGREIVALAASGDAESVILWERGGRLEERARMPGAPRALLLHPSLGVLVATSAGIGVLDGRFEPFVVRALAALGEGLLALADDGTLLEGATPGSLAPRGAPPTRALLLAPLAGGSVLLVDDDRTVHRIGADARATVVGRVPARDLFALAGAGAACVVLTRGGGAWMRSDRGRGFEPEPALRGATLVAASGQGAPAFVALVAGQLVRVTAGSASEACALAGARVLGSGDDGVLIVATDVAVHRVRLGAPVLDEGHADDGG